MRKFLKLCLNKVILLLYRFGGPDLLVVSNFWRTEWLGWCSRKASQGTESGDSSFGQEVGHFIARIPFMSRL